MTRKWKKGRQSRLIIGKETRKERLKHLNESYKKKILQNYIYPDATVFLQSRRQTCHQKIFMIVPFVLISLSIKNVS